ncbi:MAG: 4Fe-4S dicluster domain-containing protein [Desulfovibrionaceae bacterium]|nr:4Fe-4S dicluster domain-containing protein [Desulfovibrionaceae bacterium]
MSTAHNFSIRWTMVIDLDKCTGCGACMVACQTENNIPLYEDGTANNRVITWLKVYRLTNGRDFPNGDTAYLPRPCMQCGKPSCVSVCPVTATDKSENGGIVSQIYPRCIGCRYCMASCPYHARYFNWQDPIWPEGMEKTLSPDVSPRPRGVVEKCTFCHHRLMLAKDRALAAGTDPEKLPEDAYIPACAEICPSGAITFGDVMNPNHAVSKLIRSHRAFRLLERLGTEPQVWYLSSREWVRRLGDNYLSDEKTER